MVARGCHLGIGRARITPSVSKTSSGESGTYERRIVQILRRRGTNLESNLIPRALDPRQPTDDAQPLLKLSVPARTRLFDRRVEVDDLVLDPNLVYDRLERQSAVHSRLLSSISTYSARKREGLTSSTSFVAFFLLTVSPLPPSPFPNSTHHRSTTNLSLFNRTVSILVSNSATHESRFAYPSRLRLSIVF